MILSDRQIIEAIKADEIKITPFDFNRLGSNSYDVCLGDKIGIYTSDGALDAKKHNPIRLIDITEYGILLKPGQLYLGVTKEYTETHKCVPFIEGKSSVGRLGISVHSTAGKGDVGFCGHWTLEISCIQPVRIYAGMPIAQLLYFEAGECLVPYGKKEGAKYSNQPGIPIESQMFRNFL